eukprot:scaffold43533_cov79-Cyclotella_meneghiniana.AAC.2
MALLQHQMKLEQTGVTYGPTASPEVLPLDNDPNAMHNVAYVGTASTKIGIFPSFSPINKQTKVGQQGRGGTSVCRYNNEESSIVQYF